MKELLTVTHELYKARLWEEGCPPEPIRSLRALKNGTAAFQLVLGTGGRNCKVTTGGGNPLSGRMGDELYRVEAKCTFPVRLYPELYLPDENGILTADILSSAPAAEYTGAQSPVVFAEIEVPRHAEIGIYDVELAVYRSCGAHGEHKLADLTLPLQVCGYALPDAKEFRLHVDLWQHNSNLARYYGCEPWSDEHFEKIDKVLATLAALGQRSVTLCASDCPWRGWGCYLMRGTPATLYEFSAAKITRDKSGRFEYDFSAMMRYIRLCAKHGISGDITVYGLCGIWKLPYFDGETLEGAPENLLIRYLDEASGEYRYMTRAADAEAYIRALFAFFRREKLFSKVRIGADEPSDLSAFDRSVAFLKNIEPELRFKMAIDKTEVLRSHGGIVEDCAASFPCTCNDGELLKGFRGTESGRRLLWYVCNIPNKPNTNLKNEPYESLVLGALMYLFGFDGFLRWAYTCWPNEPAADIRYNVPALPAGDVALVYPNKKGGIDLSLRYKALKRGMEFCELLLRVKEACGERAAEQVVDGLILNKDFTGYMKTDRLTNERLFCEKPLSYLAAYFEAAHLIEKNGGK